MGRVTGSPCPGLGWFRLMEGTARREELKKQEVGGLYFPDFSRPYHPGLAASLYRKPQSLSAAPAARAPLLGCSSCSSSGPSALLFLP